MTEEVKDGGAASLTQAAKDVLAERERQKSVEGWTPEHDDRHDGGAMAKAAACYAAGVTIYTIEQRCYGRDYEPKPTIKDVWPWSMVWWKPKDRRRDLVRSGALIVAEIERLDRLSARKDHGHE